MGAFAYFTDTEGNVMGLWKRHSPNPSESSKVLEHEAAYHDDEEDDRPGRHGQEKSPQGEVTRRAEQESGERSG
jgi:hypothetical protein